MPFMSLTDILEEVVKLRPAEQEQVIATLLSEREVADTPERQEQFLRHLLSKGLIRRIPPRKNLPNDFQPIRIKGKPLSETIIEERR